MTNKLNIKLKSVENEIIAIENGAPESEVITCGGEDFKDGYLYALFGMREWLEDMIANCD